MLREIKRLNKSFIIIILSIMVFSIIFSFAFSYKAYVEVDSQWTYHIEKYKNIDEIPERINNLKSIQNSLNESDYDYLEQSDNIEKSIRIYEYLYENKISYNTIISYNGYSFSTNSFDFFNIFSILVTLTIFISILLLTTSLISADFSKGLIDKIYGGNSSRYRIIFNKLTAISLVSFCYFIMIIAVGIFLKNMYCFDYENILFINSNTVRALSINSCYFRIIVSLFFKFICYLLIIFSVSLLFRKTPVVILISMGIFVISYLLQVILANDYASIFMNYINLYDFDISNTFYSVSVVIKLVLLIGLFVLSLLKFNKKDLI